MSRDSRIDSVADNFGGENFHLSHYASSGTKKKKEKRANYFDLG
jgi:hypothetical protein